MKRITFAVTNDLVHDQRMHRICSTLQANKYDVVLVGRKLSGSKNPLQFNFKQVRLSCWFNSGKLFYIEYNLRLLIYLIMNASDGICAVDLDTLLACGLAAKFKKRKLIFDAHELFTEVPELNKRPTVKSVWQSIGAKYIKRTNARYTVSKSVADELKNRYDHTFEIIKNVPSLNELNTPPSSNYANKILYYQGALNVGRGLGLVLDALASELHDYQLWIAGDGDIAQALMEKTRVLNVEDRVKFLGKLDLHEMQENISKVSLGLNLLDASISKSYEASLANKTFDYMHGHLPAIHMDLPEYRRINDKCNCCFLLSDYTSQALANCVKGISEAQWKAAQENCLSAREFYNWQKESKKLIEIYNGVFN